MSQKYVNTKTLLKDVVFEEAHGLMVGAHCHVKGQNHNKYSIGVCYEGGLTLPELRLHWHMQVARDLLRYTELPLQQVMQRCGYTSMPTFSRTVRRWWGVSPQHLRILARNSGDIGKYAL